MRNSLVISAVMILFACGSGSKTGSVCESGASMPCPCDGEIMGTKTCSSDGSGWGECSGCMDDVVPDGEIVESEEDVSAVEDSTEPEDTAEGDLERPETTVELFEEDIPADVAEPLVCLKGCQSDIDCAGCEDGFVLCWEGDCAQCTPDGNQCEEDQFCGDGECKVGCPPECSDDDDCAQCEGLTACNTDVCAQCSETQACANDEFCVNGECVISCGLPLDEGMCSVDEDCRFCGEAGETWACDGAAENENGTCFKVPDGCQDIGTIPDLPDPWGQYTTACDEESDCAQSSAPIDVGQMVIDMMGTNSINVLGQEVTIQPASMDYPMNNCAEFEAMSLTCGTCVPCIPGETLCDPMNIDPLVPTLFGNDPLAAAAGALLIELLWPGEDGHNLHFWCQNATMGLGVCVPCLNPLQPCEELPVN